jgi:uncharacterized protein (DUF305 family)
MNHYHSKLSSDPCKGELSDLEYLEHMIPHHQVAIDMSNLLIPHTKNDKILHLCRDIIRKQSYEIWEMEHMKKYQDNIFRDTHINNEKIVTKLELHNPILSKSKDGDCNPLFFKPDDHSKHMEHMKINDTSYLEHMIPHHQVAVDMSKRLLIHTNNSYLMEFCRKLIIDQQGEIYYMNNLLKNRFNYQSDIL